MSSDVTTVIVMVVLSASMALALAAVLIIRKVNSSRRSAGSGGSSGSSVGSGSGSGGSGGSNGSNGSSVSSKASRCPDVQATLQAHNAARSRRGARPLVWDDGLASVAQAWSNRGVFEHSKSRYGENLAMGTGNCKEAVDLWTDEEKQWRPGMGFTMATGHFTQVVWKGSKRVGCGFAKGIVTCNYDPPGNYTGNFDANV